MPMLTARHIETRMAWAEYHMNNDWRRIIFTDETAFDYFVVKFADGIKMGKDQFGDCQKIVKK